MKFRELVEIVADEPVFETGILLAGPVDGDNIRQQLSRWTRAGYVVQLRRGLYTLAQPWQKIQPHAFLVANRLSPGSYVSGFSALAFSHVIPEYVAEVTSLGGGRPQTYQTSLGRFSFRHIKTNLRYGYHHVEMDKNQSAFVAEPEKALLDLVYLVPGADQVAYLNELRLDFQFLKMDRLISLGESSGVEKLKRAAGRLYRISRESPVYGSL